MTARPRTTVASREARTLALLAEARRLEREDPARARQLCGQAVTLNEPLARKFARKFAAGREFDDVLQASRIGLLRAAMRFDPARGVRFSTMSAWWARAEILRQARRDGGLTSYDDDLLRRLRRVDHLGLDEAAVAEQIGVSLASLEALRAVDMAARTVSLEAPVRGNDNSEPRRVSDTVAAPEVDGEARADAERLARLVETLPDRQRQIVAMRFGLGTLDGPQSWSEIARVVGVCRQRVDQLEQKGMRMLRQSLGLIEKPKPKPQPKAVDVSGTLRERLRAVLEANPDGIRLSEAAKLAGTSKNALSRMLTNERSPHSWRPDVVRTARATWLYPPGTLAAGEKGVAVLGDDSDDESPSVIVTTAPGWAWWLAPPTLACAHEGCADPAVLTWEGPNGTTSRCERHPPAEAVHVAPPRRALAGRGGR